MTIEEGSSLERIMTEGNIYCYEEEGKELATLGQGGGVSTCALGENDPSLPSIKDALRMAWDLSWDKILRKLAQALHIMAALGEIKYKSHDLEALLQLQLRSSTEATNKGQLGESSSTVSARDLEIYFLSNEVADLKWQISDLILDMSVVKTAASGGKARHYLEIEATKVAAVDEQKDKILKVGRKLTSNGNNLCLKKIAKAFPEINTEVLDHIEVSDIKSEDFEDDEVFEDPTALLILSHASFVIVFL
ncbi:hypothetical protein F0562_011374 [Nyssa sinensis]|uniref:Uncharacterized protein n=1 Tax=Nyssa sinensis TaxID=561372 RepID=A0A5J5A4X2_9ASTE|nr:hypothetical protein F0562_011374 [Nyssa sinensis]